MKTTLGPKAWILITTTVVCVALMVTRLLKPSNQSGYIAAPITHSLIKSAITTASKTPKGTESPHSYGSTTPTLVEIKEHSAKLRQQVLNVANETDRRIPANLKGELLLKAREPQLLATMESLGLSETQQKDALDVLRQRAVGNSELRRQFLEKGPSFDKKYKELLQKADGVAELQLASQLGASHAHDLMLSNLKYEAEQSLQLGKK
jgi:hypothetical protein